MRRREPEDKMAVLLAGRAAERLVVEAISGGAADDLDKATGIARSMITRYGMHDKLGQMTYDEPRSVLLGDSSAHFGSIYTVDVTGRQDRLKDGLIRLENRIKKVDTTYT